jgi:hypothetical protein
MPILTYLHLRKGGDVSLAFGSTPDTEWRVEVEHHGEWTKEIYATLLAAYLTQSEVKVVAMGDTPGLNRKVKDVLFGSDPT